MKHNITLRQGFSTLLLVLTFSGAMPVFATGGIHDLFDGVLRDHVKDGHVDYTAISQDQRFNEYLQVLKQTDAGTLKSREEKLAFWINAYNALAIQGILEGRSPSSLFGRAKYFLSTKYQAGGQEMTLDHLEKKIIIPLGEPRIHFAIVCASYSCPKLLSEAYTADRLEAQLQENTLDFINDPIKNEFNKEKRTARVSKIFDWFEEDFSGPAGSVSKYIAKYVNDKALATELENENYRIRHLKYNWSLNGTFNK